MKAPIGLRMMLAMYVSLFSPILFLWRIGWIGPQKMVSMDHLFLVLVGLPIFTWYVFIGFGLMRNKD